MSHEHELVVFLHARLDEDGDSARRYGQVDGCGEWVARGGRVDVGLVGFDGLPPALAQHVALHDPVRVLREVEAKRRVLERHALSPAEGDPERPWDDHDDCQYDGELWPCDDLLDLASVYLDHPDFPERYRQREDAGDGEG
ncbi:DUF6221 family protein [Streptomyces sp. AC495_CC817]|uniref:DUF6221 family protein n=1 Tax=Streptomyces sp. AC495_CC817 TaxID=2823900 RepID=UPI001C265DE7|nr:DUF6221 family protein [Streptomyces sp. AC495_CC817]